MKEEVQEMENKKRCGNCGKYPFCKTTEGASYYCEEWIKRNCEYTDLEETKNNRKNNIQ